MQKAAILVAGGSGSRMGNETPKQFLPLGGKPILIHTVQTFLKVDPSMPIVLVLPKAHIDYWNHHGTPYLSKEDQARIFLCQGGASRTLSVFEGLKLLNSIIESPQNYWVAIQDGVRPFMSQILIQEAYETAYSKGASVCCVAVKSSLRKRSGATSVAIDRSQYFHVQTPQTFNLKKIVQAYQDRQHDQFTDDASLYEAWGEEVAICAGSYDNIKITTPEDLLIAEQILNRISTE